ncbi:MAG: hypothetical protein GQ569_08080 [Methylococcaceae bacterium]|nr:hypothetical protein [Methylococcaceae bacterium]
MKIKTYVIPFMMSCSLMSTANISHAASIEQGEIVFKKGYVSGAVKGSVIRGDSDHYSLIAGAGQWMEVTISSLEDNAVFAVTAYSYGSGEDIPIAGNTEVGTGYWYGRLPNPAYSKNGKQNALDFYVMGSRGNTSYKMTVKIKNKSWK